MIGRLSLAARLVAIAAVSGGADIPRRATRHVDPGKTPLGSPRPLPVGVITVALETRQLRRARERAERKGQA